MGEIKHILMVTVAAHGHYIPMSQLADKIAKHHRVTLALPQAFLDVVRADKIEPKEDSISLLGIQDGLDLSDPSSLAGFKTIVIPSVKKLFQSVFDWNGETKLQSACEVRSPVDAVIADDMLAPALPTLHALGVPFYVFNSGSSGRMLHYLSVNADTPVCEESVSRGEQPFIAVPSEGKHPPPMLQIIKDILLPIHENVHLATGVIAATMSSLEADLVERIRKHPDMRGVGLFNVGPHVAGGEAQTDEERKVEVWLDAREPASVIYIAFGTMGEQPPERVRVIAEALLAIGRPFIWSLLADRQVYLPEELRDGIERQLNGEGNCKGLILTWAPQRMILNHQATAVFVSHCGWNSTMDSLIGGVPVVAWPQGVDQMMNALMLMRNGTAVLVDEGDRANRRTVGSGQVERIIRSVLDDESYKKAANSWKNAIATSVAPKGESHNEFLALIAAL
ncbi:putative UDP-glycosyltransferase 84B1 [Hypsibius exemplaris]|uniref:UDP-glucuronosyltransferase n=1 Tax=Hypsibius exemplaris TaxID=2072580 RepID=A0A1W0WYY3_HYPEX|nr:putative UDP-glycosyltransferase 84B1 [Hypsibius exemplaris]